MAGDKCGYRTRTGTCGNPRTTDESGRLLDRCYLTQHERVPAGAPTAARRVDPTMVDGGAAGRAGRLPSAVDQLRSVLDHARPVASVLDPAGGGPWGAPERALASLLADLWPHQDEVFDAEPRGYRALLADGLQMASVRLVERGRSAETVMFAGDEDSDELAYANPDYGPGDVLALVRSTSETAALRAEASRVVEKLPPFAGIGRADFDVLATTPSDTVALVVLAATPVDDAPRPTCATFYFLSGGTGGAVKVRAAYVDGDAPDEEWSPALADRLAASSAAARLLPATPISWDDALGVLAEGESDDLLALLRAGSGQSIDIAA